LNISIPQDNDANRFVARWLIIIAASSSVHLRMRKFKKKYIN